MNTATASPMEIAAHTAVVNGWSVFPLKPRDKTPLTAHGCLDASRHHDQVTAWWSRWPEANLGIATGTASALFVVDVDGAAGEAALTAFGTLPHTVEVLTGKGRHLYFELPDGVMLGNSARKLGPELDTRGDGGYVVAPPSIHPNGHAYAWAPEHSPDEIDVAAVPDAILRALQPSTPPAVAVASQYRTAQLSAPSRGPLTLFLAWLRTVDSGLADGQGRNHTAYRIASRALECMPLQDVRDVVGAWNSANRPPLSDRELTQCVNSAAGIRRSAA